MSLTLDFLAKVFFKLREVVTALLVKKMEKKVFITPLPPNTSCLDITENIALLKKIIINSRDRIDSGLHQKQGRSLVLLFGWLSAQRKHIYKFAAIWMDMGYDVLIVDTKPWQISWPVMGSQVVANDILKFLDHNEYYSSIILHGFSVGAYQWSEVMVQMAQDMERYQRILDKIVGQVWDSAADVAEAHIGVPAAVFPTNKFLAAALGKYMLFHLRIFDKVVTTHLETASKMFHNTLVRSPALMILSKTDPIGNVGVHQRTREDWERQGMTVYWKCFEKSPHVGHFRTHPEEYMDQLYTYLDKLNLNEHPHVHSESKQTNIK